MDPWSKMITTAVDTVLPNMVHVTGYGDDDTVSGYGSGFILDRSHVLTSAPVVNGASRLTIQTSNERTLTGHALAVDPLYFLAVVKLDERHDLPLPSFGDPELRAGVMVAALGDPFGLDHTVSIGVISAEDRTVYRPERIPVDGLLITDAAIHPGNTGGPLINMEGRIVGVNGIPWAQGLGLAVHSDVVLRVANQIIEYGQASHPWLGFSGEPQVVDSALVRLFSLPVDRGLVVVHVQPGGPGDRAGIKTFDMVVRVDGKPARHVGFIRRMLAAHRIGDTATLSLLRDGELVDLEFPVDEIPNLSQAES